MAFRRRRRKVTRRPARRTKGRGRKKSGGRKYTSRQPVLTAQKQIVHLRYCDSFQTNPGLPYSNFLWNLNSLFDPDRSGVGHQPSGFDQWKLFYGQYRVFAASGSVSVAISGGSGYNVLALMTQNGTLTYSVLTDVLEAPGTRYRQIGNNVTGSPPVRMKFKYYLPKILGQTPAQYKADENTAAATTTSPAETICLNTYVASIDGISLLTSIQFTFDITFHAELFDRIVPNGS